MEIVGYLAYAILIFFALTWTLAVRIKLDMGLHTILGALFFLLVAISLGAFKVEKLHALWLLPAGFIFSLTCAFIIGKRIPLLFQCLMMLASIYAGIIRVGISPEKIRRAQKKDLMESIERFSKTKSKRSE